ncbi:MAG: quinolinate synthase NadA, partial [Draconibacterium sp.]|nr:quinolinate synthase NadA [Draconibacterium sp.]
CNDCEYMKLNSLQKLYTCLKYEQPEVLLSEDVIEMAKVPILCMLDLSK